MTESTKSNLELFHLTDNFFLAMNSSLNIILLTTSIAFDMTVTSQS